MGIGVVFSAASFSQTFTEDFESYTAGAMLVASNPSDWGPWYGNSNDVAISNANASSGANSIYFSTTSANNNWIKLKFAPAYNSGNFTFESNFFVEPGKGAYFAFEGKSSTGAYAQIACNMGDNGILKLHNLPTNVELAYLITPYPTGQWFSMRIEIDLTTSIWVLFINNVSQGTFSNPTMRKMSKLGFASYNPINEGGNDTAGFYVDDVSYNHIPANLPPVNSGVVSVNQLMGIAGQGSNVVATLRNLGSSAITSFDIEYTYAGGTPVQESVGSINFASLADTNYTFTTPITLVSGSNTLTVTVSNVNGAGADAIPGDDSKSITLNTTIPAAGKMVFIEESTGTWCEWCPRGTVFLNYMENTYPTMFAGVAVHHNDPMTDPIYNAGLGGIIINYPQVIVDREPAQQDPSMMEPPFLQRIALPPTALISIGAIYDASTRLLEVSVTYDFQLATSGDWKIGVVLTEDGVTGTTADYDQKNAYAGGGSGVMGGYELLPNPVPAAQMVYDHVGRSIVPSFDGMQNAFPATIASGSQHTACFSFTLPAAWDDTKMHILSFLRDPSGRVDNAGKETIASAVTNGLAVCTVGLIETDLSAEDNFKLFPNPTNGVTFIDITNNDNSNVSVKITDMNGKIVGQRNYNINGTVQLPIETNGLSKGIYFVTLTIGDTIQQQKLIIQ